MRRILSAILVIAMLCLALVSCGGGREDVLYVFFNKEDVPDCDHLTVYEMDGITAARVSSQS